MQTSLKTLAWIVAAFAAAPAVAQQHTETVAETRADDEEVEDVTKLVVTLGGVLQTGNTETLQLSAGSRFELVRGIHAFTADVAYVLSPGPDFDFENPIANNVNGRVRYDLYFTPMDAAFLAALVRYDRFANLAPRLSFQAGYLRNFFLEANEEGEPTHRFWGELGPDLTIEFLDYGLTDPMRMPRSETDVQVSARLFIGYLNQLNENVAYKTGVEGLINLIHPGDSRINWDNTLTMKFGENFALDLRFLLQVDTDPAGDDDPTTPDVDEEAEPIDTLTQLNLVITLI
jgi:putative salt-induced outer membrane protein YdiY